MTTKQRSSVEQRLNMDEAMAWAEYTEATKDKHGKSYEDLEPYAWARLQTSLRRIKDRRRKLQKG
jgi:hypothetical protein